MDSRGPKHFGALVEVVLDSPYGWSSGKIVAESCPEGCPLNFGRSKVRTLVKIAKKMIFCAEIPETPYTIGYWFKWFWTLHMVGLRGKL